MGWGIFAFVLVVVLLEVLVGVLRGVKLSGIRFGYTLLGTLLAALIAKRLTITVIMQIAAANGLKGSNLTKVIENVFKDGQYAAIGAAAAPHIAGLSLSVLIPLVFVPLFLLLKLIGLFLYLITKAIIKAISKNKDTESEKPAIPAYSRALGGVIGAVVGLLTCAIITMPVFNLITTIEESGMKDTIFGILEKTAGSNQVAMEKNEALVAVAEALVYGDAVPVYAADDSDTATIAGVKISIIKKLYESTASSPAIAVLKYTGVEAVSNAIINASATVKPEDVGAKKVKTESYNLQESLVEILDVIEPISELVVVIATNENFSIDELDKVIDFASKFEKADFLEEEDKLEILNACKEVITETIYTELGIDSAVEISDYSDIKEFKSDVEAIVEMSKVLASVSGSGEDGNVSAGSLTNIDVEALLKDEEKLRSFISSTLNLSNGMEIICTLINDNVSKYSDGKYHDIVTVERLNSIGKQTIIDTSESLMKFTKYDKNSVLTDELKKEINEAIDDVASKGIITYKEAEDIKAEFNLK